MVTATALSRTEGMAFGIRDPIAWFQTLDGQSPLRLIEELRRNGTEAGGKVDIFPDEHDRTVVLDNGSGMSASEMEQYLANFGSGAKARGGEGNLGMGPKLCALAYSREGVTYYSLKHGKCHKMVWGENQNGFGPLIQSNGKTVIECRPPKDLAEVGQGTMVVVHGIPFNRNEILKFLNNIMLEPKLPVTVWQRRGEHLYEENVKGLIGSLQAICEEGQFGVVDGRHATVYWGIKKPEEELTRSVTWTFAPESFYVGWNGIVYYSRAMHRGAGHRLGAYGVSFGTPRVILVVVAKGRGIKPLADRTNFVGWNEDLAVKEWLENMPEELIEFQEQIKAQTVVAEDFSDQVIEILNLVLRDRQGVTRSGVGLPAGRPISLPGNRPRRSRSGGGSSGGGGASSSTTRLTRGLEVAWTNGSDLRGARIELRGSILVLNREHPKYAELLAAAKNAQAIKNLLAFIAADALAGVLNFTTEVGVKPQDLTPRDILACTAPNMLGSYYALAGSKRAHAPRLPRPSKAKRK